MKHYETIGGQVTRGETYAKLCDMLRDAEECCYILGHLHNTEDGSKDALIATGWRGVGQLLEKVRAQIGHLAAGRLN